MPNNNPTGINQYSRTKLTTGKFGKRKNPVGMARFLSRQTQANMLRASRRSK